VNFRPQTGLKGRQKNSKEFQATDWTKGSFKEIQAEKKFKGNFFERTKGQRKKNLEKKFGKKFSIRAKKNQERGKIKI
jgi:hypothetical protein